MIGSDVSDALLRPKSREQIPDDEEIASQRHGW